MPRSAFASDPISRRTFLQRSGLALAGTLLPDSWLRPFLESPRLDSLNLSSPDHGRVLDETISVYDRPSRSGKLVKMYWKDVVVPISEATIGEGEPTYNRIWYHIGSEGYAHSGSIQPVQIHPQEANPDIPEGGRLAEVSVPFTDARWKPDPGAMLAYRLYYQTTHWVTGLNRSLDGQQWYTLWDDKWKFNYYVPVKHLRLIPAEELAPISPHIPAERKRIEIRLKDQVVVAFEDERPVFMARAATGGVFSNGDFSTPTGQFMTFHKRPFRHMAAGDLAAPNSYDLPGVPWVCYFTPEGISFHGTYWHNDFGKPRSHGCINLAIPAARWIYLWTQPVVPSNEMYSFETEGTFLDIL